MEVAALSAGKKEERVNFGRAFTKKDEENEVTTSAPTIGELQKSSGTQYAFCIGLALTVGGTLVTLGSAIADLAHPNSTETPADTLAETIVPLCLFLGGILSCGVGALYSRINPDEVARSSPDGLV